MRIKKREKGKKETFLSVLAEIAYAAGMILLFGRGCVKALVGRDWASGLEKIPYVFLIAIGILVFAWFFRNYEITNETEIEEQTRKQREKERKEARAQQEEMLARQREETKKLRKQCGLK